MTNQAFLLFLIRCADRWRCVEWALRRVSPSYRLMQELIEQEARRIRAGRTP